MATTNGGINWGTQLSPVVTPGGVWIIDSLLVWAYNGSNNNNLIKTTNGGGNITYNAIEPIGNTVPLNYQLKQNYPNPFNPVTTIEFDIAKSSLVKIIIYNVLGTTIETIADEQLTAGSFKVIWDASRYSSGVYYYKLITNDFTQTKKMVLIK